ncbi:envelope stress response membrane protein PspB [Tanticharoenia sakaeratensis]|jgi:phage shock protein B|uniref:Phage shock protein B n=1 Tax=Tanticharoenia sakaeratensis NBRC 103193 TaxID=1231623 RepID=A0A0D6MMB5_9PROT|nr:envelope stress response membrane protein PspB [Tanticharoenia sakaeratensis]GAN54814.1 hypothetical protein Tasa_031_032 [Tanticharoenia sakaeratensis NBRC 103193]GBQ21477.1 hypothetical protein AA103193_1741 [Tanticharoenia sakaeratensis NBRC 103193]
MDWNLAVILLFVFAVITISQRTKLARRVGMGPVPVDIAALERAQAQARRLEERIDHLERILDEDAPGWRGTRGA